MHCLTNRFSILELCTSMDDPNKSKPEELQINLRNLKRGKKRPMSNNILIRTISNQRSTELQIQLESISSHHPMAVTALLDSGATGLFIDIDFVYAKNLTTTKLPKAIPVYNIDGSLNDHGSIKESVDLIV